MKRLVLLLVAAAAAVLPSFAQSARNDNADSIVGEYLVPDAKNGDSKVRFTKNAAGTYDCQVFWLAIPNDPKTGEPWLDFRNPDKSLRSGRVDRLVVIKGLKYDAGKKTWEGAKIYDPNRGLNANVKCRFADDNTLEVRGTVLGVGEKHNWKRLK